MIKADEKLELTELLLGTIDASVCAQRGLEWLGRQLGPGRALQWWLAQLESPTTRAALLERHRGILA